MGTLLPLVGKGPAVANPAEKAVPESSLESFLITSILDTICLPLGGFSGTSRVKKSLSSSKESFCRSLNILTVGCFFYPKLQHGEPLLASELQAFQLLQG